MQTIHDLGFVPRSWQAEAFRNLKRFSILVVHRRGGKTLQAVMRLIHEALKCKKHQGRYAYIAPQLKQTKDIVWSYLKHYASKVPGCLINETELWVEFPESAGLSGARIRLYGAEDPQSLRGRYFDGIVVDELAQIKKELWTEVLLPCLADRQGWCFLIGTPHGQDLLWDLYHEALRKENWYAKSYTYLDTNALPSAEIETMKCEMTPEAFRQEMLCDFTASDTDVLIPVDQVIKAQKTTYQEHLYNFAPKILGIDVAWQGGDRSVIYQRQGLASFQPKIYPGIPEQTFAGHIAEVWREWGADACFVDNTGGYGGEVVSRLTEAGFSPTPVVFSGKAYSERFLNIRAEMWWKMAEWIKGGGALWDDERLRKELSLITYNNNNAAGKLQLERKEDFKDRIGWSPDSADALALTFAHPVYKQVDVGPLARTHKVKSDWDPYGDSN